MSEADNLPSVVAALRKRGASVASLANRGAGWPRILCGFMGINLMFEVARPGELTEAQRDWHQTWHGQVHIIADADGAMALLDKLEEVSRMPGGPKYVEGDFDAPKPWEP